jgi:hypothetical protein
MRYLTSLLLLSGLAWALTGCGRPAAPGGQDLETLQKQNQQKADDAERQYQQRKQ